MKKAALALLFCGALARAQPRTEPPSPASGKDMFRAYCAPCHGRDAKGNGPAASAFRTPPSDLTALAQKHGGRFPGAEVAKELSSVYQAPHGSIDMPVWGPIFTEISPKSDAVGALRVTNIVRYIETLQAK
ncbi:MAG TPA: c-type cytochrome [Bryobacteraceae bacterium]|nr:c-type cytochrome [Bryobacteraceae bacterium]